MDPAATSAFNQELDSAAGPNCHVGLDAEYVAGKFQTNQGPSAAPSPTVAKSKGTDRHKRIRPSIGLRRSCDSQTNFEPAFDLRRFGLAQRIAPKPSPF